MSKKENQCKYPLCINYKPGAEKYCCGSCYWQDFKRIQNKKIPLTIKDLKRIVEQDDNSSDDSPIAIALSISTTYRIDKCQIEPIKGSDILFAAVNITRDTDTKALVLSIE